MSLAVYIRISSKNQKTDSQRAEITRWLENHNHSFKAIQWYEDVETGSIISREAMDQLNKDVFDGVVKTIVVWKLDRIARTQIEGINTLHGWCKAGVRVVSVTQQIDLSGSVGQMLASVFFGIAEIEYNNIKERQAAGIAVAKAKGVYKGRVQGSTKKKPNRAKELQEKGLSASEIAQAMGISRRTVYRYLVQN